jgi:acyl CoA:acetate/3-ketoacid CoA transferase beta subunit
VTSSGRMLRELAPGVGVHEVRAATEPPVVEAHDLHEMEIAAG